MSIWRNAICDESRTYSVGSRKVGKPEMRIASQKMAMNKNRLKTHQKL